MNKLVYGVALSALLLGAAGAAEAGPHMERYFGGACGCNANARQALSDEQKKNVDNLFAEHLAAIEPLREQLQAKKLELNALSRNPNTEPETIRKLAGDIAGLNSKMRQAGRELHEKLDAMGVNPSCDGDAGGV